MVSLYTHISWRLTPQTTRATSLIPEPTKHLEGSQAGQPIKIQTALNYFSQRYPLTSKTQPKTPAAERGVAIHLNFTPDNKDSWHWCNNSIDIGGQRSSTLPPTKSHSCRTQDTNTACTRMHVHAWTRFPTKLLNREGRWDIHVCLHYVTVHTTHPHAKDMHVHHTHVHAHACINNADLASICSFIHGKNNFRCHPVWSKRILLRQSSTVNLNPWNVATLVFRPLWKFYWCMLTKPPPEMRIPL